MRLIRIVLIGIFLQVTIFAKDEFVKINFKNLQIKELIQLTSKILNKNILFTDKLVGKIDFITNKPVKKSELLNIVNYVLEEKGYSIIENNNILRVTKLTDITRQNIPISQYSDSNSDSQMITRIIQVNNANVDYISSRIRHIMSKNAKLVTEKNSNVIVLTDFKENVKTIQKIVSLITKDAKKISEVVKINNLKASEVKTSLDTISKSLFNQKVEKDKVVIIETKENNSIMLIGQKKNIEFLKEHIKKIDTKESLSKNIVEVIYLKNIESKNLINILTNILLKKRYLDEKEKPIVSVDEETNSIILIGIKNELDNIKSLITQLDKEKAQVYVQARIIEVNDNLVDKVGFQYGLFGWNSGNNGLTSFSTSLNEGSAPSLSTATELGLDINNLSSALALGASLNLLKENGAVDIVSEPSILAVNNKESSIYVGETISIKTSSNVSDGGTTSDNFTRDDVGLTLKVKPRISNDNKVTLDINTILEDVNLTSVSAGENPDTSKKEVKTTAIVNNGESVIIGGLIQNKKSNTTQKVPLLGDIPLLGELFKNKKSENTKNNLVIIVTPYLIPKSKDITYIRGKLAELKLMEDKYLQDALVRLKKKKIKASAENKKREERLKDLDKKTNSVQEDSQRKRLYETLGIEQ